MPNFMQAPNVPDMLSPKGMGMGDTSWYQPGEGTLGFYLGDQLSRLQGRADMQEQIAGKEQERFNAVVPNEIAESNLSGNVAKYLDTPGNVATLGSGRLGEAYSQEAKGREAQGMVTHNLSKAGYETDALFKLQQENNRHDALSQALTLGQMIGGSTLHPALSQWKKAVGSVVESYGFKPDSPEFQQAMQEWAIPSEATMGSFKQAMDRSALQKQEHIRNLDTIRAKGEWAVKTAEADKTNDQTLEKTNMVAWTKVLTDATTMIWHMEREKRETLAHKATYPAGEKRDAFVKEVNDYYNGRIRAAYAQKNLALKSLGMKEEPEDLAPDIPEPTKPGAKTEPGKAAPKNPKIINPTASGKVRSGEFPKVTPEEQVERNLRQKQVIESEGPANERVAALQQVLDRLEDTQRPFNIFDKAPQSGVRNSPKRTITQYSPHWNKKRSAVESAIKTYGPRWESLMPPSVARNLLDNYDDVLKREERTMLSNVAHRRS